MACRRTRTIIALMLLGVLVALAADNVVADDGFGDEADEAIVEEESMSPDVAAEKKKMGPLPYETPSAPSPYHFVDAFPSTSNVIGKRWIKSEAGKDGAEEDIAKYDGEWAVKTPDTIVLDNDFGLVLTTRARHHAISAKLERPFNFEGTPFIMQFEVKLQEGQECGGAYVKLLTQTPQLNLKQFTDKTPYTIMFGPDKCGLSSKVHLIFRYENPRNHSISEHHAKQPKSIAESLFNDKMTHLYTLVLRADGAFEVLVDDKEIMGGNMNTDLLPPLEPEVKINDPADVRPGDWDDRAKIDDADATKPDEWDEDAPEKVVDSSASMPDGWLEDEPSLIADVTADKPDDWDVDMDGEWEAAQVSNPKCTSAPGCGVWHAPMIPNSEYKGKWKAPRIDNPAYQGKWTARLIDNPAYFKPEGYALSPIGAIGLELWTMSEGILFDNFLVTEDRLVAKQFAQATFGVKSAHESAMHRSANIGVVEGYMNTLVDYANETPAYWALYVLIVLVPIVLIVVFCCSSSKDASPSHKKTDDVQPDDEEEEEVDGEEEIEMEEEPTPSTSGEGIRQRKQQQEDLEGEEEEETAAKPNKGNEGETAAKAKKSPGRRPRARKE